MRWQSSKVKMSEADIHLMNIQKSMRFYPLNVYLLNKVILRFFNSIIGRSQNTALFF